MVKILNSLFLGSVAKILQRVVNSDFPGPFKYLTGYVAIIVSLFILFKYYSLKLSFQTNIII